MPAVKSLWTMTLLLLALVAVSRPSSAQSELSSKGDDEAESLLRRVAATYQGLTDFYFSATEVTETRSEGFERKTEARYVIAADSSGRARVEVSGQSNDSISVFDGNASWFYAPRLGQYVKRTAAAPATAGPPGRRPFDIPKSAARYANRFSGAATRLVRSKIARREPADLSKEKVSYAVVEAEYETPPGVPQGKIQRTYWIDESRAVVTREVSVAVMTPANLGKPVEVRQTISFRTVKVNEPLPAATFAFVPPQGAERVERFGPTAQSVSRMLGRPAADFALADLSGKPVRLRDLLGKVVLLDFWATWCKPCRIDLPHMEALHRELAGKGLVVLGINGEPPQLARRFFDEQGYSFRSLVDRGLQVSRQYLVGALPTIVVVDRTGKISAYLVGLHPEERLRAALAKAGIQ